VCGKRRAIGLQPRIAARIDDCDAVERNFRLSRNLAIAAASPSNIGRQLLRREPRGRRDDARVLAFRQNDCAMALARDINKRSMNSMLLTV